MRVLVTGGAGFVGSTLALRLASAHPGWDVVALDNLQRRGSELNLPRLETGGVSFVRGDVREAADLDAVGRVDALVECSAEPSVLAGADGSPDYVVSTNLVGAYRCLEHCRRHDAQMVFLSTSRVYPVAHLRSLSLEERDSRFELAAEQPMTGASAEGISESFPLAGARTLYGATKLSAEHLVEEYRAMYGLSATVVRFGVIAGPWQMGKVDQGFVAHWVLAHQLGEPLRYLGFGGTGKQVRDVLHVEDAAALIEEQLVDPGGWDGVVANAGGGVAQSVSLRELTDLTREATGKTTLVETGGEDRPGDVPLYVSDCSLLRSKTGWRPERDLPAIVEDVARWASSHAGDLRRSVTHVPPP